MTIVVRLQLLQHHLLLLLEMLKFSKKNFFSRGFFSIFPKDFWGERAGRIFWNILWTIPLFFSPPPK
jgi:hypothetical protein